MSEIVLHLGPINLPWPLDSVTESVGGSLEAVGRALVAGDDQARKFPLKLQIRGSASDSDPRAVGLRLRRQVRQLLDNTAWRSGGLYFSWDVDGDLDAWLQIAGGEIEETDPGIGFGDFVLNLPEVYIIGHPATHRPARRIDVADHRTGLVARDTRGLLRNTDYASIDLPQWLAAIPGDTTGRPTGAYGRALPRLSGLDIGTRSTFNLVRATPGERVSYRPADSVLGAIPASRRYQEIEDYGSVRAWNVDTSGVWAVYPGPANPDPASFGWERLYGQPLKRNARIALDNTLVRCTWTGYTAGPAPGGGILGDMGLLIERYDAAIAGTDKMRRVGAFYFGVNRVDGSVQAKQIDIETSIIECTPERAVMEIRSGAQAMRVILQRGWGGPRLEVYNDEPVGGSETYIRNFAGAAVLEFCGHIGWSITPPNVAGSYPNLELIARSGAGELDIVAHTAADVVSTFVAPTTGFVPPAGATQKAVRWARPRVLVIQHETPVLYATPVGDPANHGGLAATGPQIYCAGRALADIIPVPTIVARG